MAAPSSRAAPSPAACLAAFAVCWALPAQRRSGNTSCAQRGRALSDFKHPTPAAPCSTCCRVCSVSGSAPVPESPRPSQNALPPVSGGSAR
eukprot:4763517-Lingulodinium_polyedra.AAC.1